MMGNFKGTKGRWHAGKHGHIVNEFGSTVCQTYSKQEIDYDNHKSNALLISKAPEMLEMLEELLDAVDWSVDQWQGNGGREREDKIKQLIKSATTP